MSLCSPMPSLDFSRKQALITAPAQCGKRAPLWKEAGNLFTVRYDKSGRRCIVKKRSVPWWVHGLSTLHCKGLQVAQHLPLPCPEAQLAALLHSLKLLHCKGCRVHSMGAAALSRNAPCCGRCSSLPCAG